MLRVLTRLDAGIEPLAALLMAAMTAVVFLGVVYRYVLLAPLPWVEEIARLCLVWVTFLGTYLAMRRGQHIAMTLLRERLSGPARRAAERTSAVLLTAFFAVLAWYGARYAYAFRAAPTPYLELPTGLAYAALPVGAVLLGLALLPAVLAAAEPDVAGPGARS